jgi:hypothetical protein
MEETHNASALWRQGNLSEKEARTYRACAQLLGQLRRMIDRGGQSIRRGLLTNRKKNRSRNSAGDVYGESRSYDGPVMHGARAMPARRLLVLRIRLRTLRDTVIALQISNRIGNDITSEGAQREKASHGEQPGCASETH